MTERPGWWPPNPYYAILLPHPDEAQREEGWNEGVEAGVKAVIERIEGIMGAAVINNGPRVRFLVDELWLSLRKEVGLE